MTRGTQARRRSRRHAVRARLAGGDPDLPECANDPRTGRATKPFSWEGVGRRRIADAAAERLAGTVDALIVVPNDRVGEVMAADASLVDSFRAVDDVLLWAARGIIGLTTTPGLVNVDFADIRSVLLNAGPTLIGVGREGGQDRAIEAARQGTTTLAGAPSQWPCGRDRCARGRCWPGAC